MTARERPAWLGPGEWAHKTDRDTARDDWAHLFLTGWIVSRVRPPGTLAPQERATWATQLHESRN